jgi:hypothetical protein
MKRIVIIVIIAIALTSCATLQTPKTLGQVKTNLVCFEYKDGIYWEQISEKIGAPDIAPLPESGTDLSKNARVYKNMTIIFYTERQEVKENGKVRFYEIVKNIEICKKK